MLEEYIAGWRLDRIRALLNRNRWANWVARRLPWRVVYYAIIRAWGGKHVTAQELAIKVAYMAGMLDSPEEP